MNRLRHCEVPKVAQLAVRRTSEREAYDRLKKVNDPHAFERAAMEAALKARVGLTWHY